MFLNDAAPLHSFTSPRDDKGPKSVGGGGGRGREQTTRAPAEIGYKPAGPLALCLGGRSSVDCARGGKGGESSGLLAAQSQELATKTGRIDDNIFPGVLGRWDGSNYSTYPFRLLRNVTGHDT